MSDARCRALAVLKRGRIMTSKLCRINAFCVI